MDVIALAVELPKLHVEIRADARENLSEAFEMLWRQDPAPPFRGEHEMGMQAKYDVATCSDVHRPT
jgi:hypothetical protein